MASHVSGGCELRYSEHNDDADPHAQYDYQAWKKARLEPLKRCVNEGAQIIALGEFDYPPQFDDENDKDF